jgi:hypothetical protein
MGVVDTGLQEPWFGSGLDVKAVRAVDGQHRVDVPAGHGADLCKRPHCGRWCLIVRKARSYNRVLTHAGGDRRMTERKEETTMNTGIATRGLVQAPRVLARGHRR